MIRLRAFLAVGLGCFLGCYLSPVTAVGGEFEIHVTVKADGQEVRTTRTDEDPSRDRRGERPVMEIARNSPIVLSWRAENTGKSDAFEDVLVHFFVVEEARTGQTTVPKLNQGVAYEGAMTMDFQPKDKTDWRVTFKIPETGSYLLRVETQGMLEKHGHEHFAAMDLIVR
jgi:hypothetical protein